MNSLLDFKLISLIPQYLKENPDIIAFCEAWDSEKEKIILSANRLDLIKRINSGDLTKEEVELLLYENHVDYFDSTLSEEQKIKLIQISYDSHQKKGTVYSIEQQLDIIIDDFKLLEWFDFEGDPNTFYVLGRTYPEESILVKIEKIVKSYKRASSHMQTIFGIFNTPTIFFKATEKYWFSKMNLCGTQKTEKVDYISTDGRRIKDVTETHEVSNLSELFNYLGTVCKNSKGSSLNYELNGLDSRYFSKELVKLGYIVNETSGYSTKEIMSDTAQNFNSSILNICSGSSTGVLLNENIDSDSQTYYTSIIKICSEDLKVKEA